MKKAPPDVAAIITIKRWREEQEGSGPYESFEMNDAVRWAAQKIYEYRHHKNGMLVLIYHVNPIMRWDEEDFVEALSKAVHKKDARALSVFKVHFSELNECTVEHESEITLVH